MVDFSKALANAKKKQEEKQTGGKELPAAKPSSGFRLQRNVADETVQPKTTEALLPKVSEATMSIADMASMSVDNIPARNKDKERPTRQSLTISVEDYYATIQDDAFDPDQVARIRDSLHILETNLEDRNVVGDAIRHVMMTLQDAPELVKILRPEDIGLMTKGLQESYGTVMATKTQKSAKRAKNQELIDMAASLILGDGGPSI